LGEKKRMSTMCKLLEVNGAVKGKIKPTLTVSNLEYRQNTNTIGLKLSRKDRDLE
jgi:hypothetical protein